MSLTVENKTVTGRGGDMEHYLFLLLKQNKNKTKEKPKTTHPSRSLSRCSSHTFLHSFS